MDEIILLDNENLLAAAMEYAREKSDETAIIPESFRADNIITLENSISIQRHIKRQIEAGAAFPFGSASRR